MSRSAGSAAVRHASGPSGTARLWPERPIGPARQSRPRFPKAEQVVRRDDGVIEQRDLDRFQGVADAAGHVDVRPGWLGTIARMVVDDDERAGLKLKAAHAGLPGIDRRVTDGAVLMQFVGDEPVSPVELCRYLHNSTYVQPIFMWSWVVATALLLETDDTNFT